MTDLNELTAIVQADLHDFGFVMRSDLPQAWLDAIKHGQRRPFAIGRGSNAGCGYYAQ
ncbi:hypothetical protein [Novosphingobium sp. B1]|uniref:hypothetical protein n=1 Tax=Novosphingobium sp. B1 TaxID=1938756 RepID=UPI00159350AE|nr:hypothetical protein [Novosphingobium sp. B1]